MAVHVQRPGKLSSGWENGKTTSRWKILGIWNRGMCKGNPHGHTTKLRIKKKSQIIPSSVKGLTPFLGTCKVL